MLSVLVIKFVYFLSQDAFYEKAQREQEIQDVEQQHEQEIKDINRLHEQEMSDFLRSVLQSKVQ